jgi:hypothetical protein
VSETSYTVQYPPEQDTEHRNTPFFATIIPQWKTGGLSTQSWRRLPHDALVARFSFLNSIPTITASLYMLIIHSLVHDSPLSNRNDGILLTHGTVLLVSIQVCDAMDT